MISVIIPTCGREGLLARCLDRLEPGQQTLSSDEYEVIVSDDGARSVERFLAEHYPWVLWTPGPRKGPAANRNAGSRRTRGEWLAFTDDDCLPDADWLLGYRNAIREDVHIYEGKTTCEAGVNSPIFHAPVNTSGGWLWSCNMLIRRETFTEVGGFDEEFRFPHLEDVDFRERCVRAGQEIVFVEQAIVDHPPRRIPSGFRLARYHESEVYYFYKSGCPRLSSFRIPFRIARARCENLSRYPFSGDTLKAIGSLATELSSTMLRLPHWEWKYSRRFRTPSTS